MKRRLILAALAHLTVALQSAPAETYTVNTSSDNAVASNCTSHIANCSLRGAIMAANAHSGDTINFSIVEFCPISGCTINLSSALPDISAPMTITGPTSHVIQRSSSAATNFRIFNVTTNGTVSFSSLTISKGNFVLSSGVFFGGGGISNSAGGTVNITNCTISGNVVAGGGLGGGVANVGTGTINITSSAILDNSVGSTSGGGIANSFNGTTNIINSTVSGNSAGFGGGISNGGTLTLSNSTISGNTASGNGGCGGVFSNGTATIKSSLIALNTGANPDVAGTFSSAGFNLVGKTDGATGFTALSDKTGTIAAPLDPALDPLGLQDNGGATKTIALLCGSPAIDQASSTALIGTLTTDQRGSPRAFDDPAKTNVNGGDGTDIGAFERQQSCPISGNLTVTTIADSNDGFCGATCSLRDALNAANANANSKVINFAAGVQGTIQLIGPLPSLTRPVTIGGPGANVLTVRRNTGGDYRVFTITNGTTTGPVVNIAGLTLSNGKASGSGTNQGGAILNDHGTLTLTNVAVTDNAATNGAGIYNNGTSGGSAILTISNSTLARNAGNFGGALFNHGFQGVATANITNTTISDNTAGRGAAVHNGGASGDANLELRNCTISGNSATLGGIYNDGSSGHAGIFTGNTIFKIGATGSNVTNIAGAISSRGNNLSDDAAGGDGTTSPGGFLSGTGDKRNTNPQLDGNGLQSNGGPTQTIALLSNSPAINTGSDALAPATDQRGFGRNGISDIGAFEFSGALPTPSPTPTATPTATATATPKTVLGNISTRLRVETGDNTLIGGFIVTGSSQKTVIVRGLGPSLAQFFSGTLNDPTLELHSGNVTLETNDNWQDNSAEAAQISANGFALADPHESGIFTTLSPGQFTAILAGKNGGTGIGLVELYDLSQSVNSELGNISTRGFVLTDNNVMIGGFIVSGSATTRIVVRGIGPSLAQFGLNPVLADPTLELHDSNGGIIATDDNWQDDPNQAAQLSANGFALSDPKEAAIFIAMPVGQFTAILAGKNGGTGIGLVEIYNVH